MARHHLYGLLLLIPVPAGCVSEPSTRPAGGGGAPSSKPVRAEDDAAERIALAREIHRPGRHHHALSALEGEWRISVRREEIDGSHARAVGTGHARISWTMGGLFLRWDVELEVGGASHLVTGFLGYDVVQEQYQALWISELSSGLSLAQGDGDPRGRGIVLQQPWAPQRGQPSPRSVLRLLDEDHFTIESIGTNARGEEGVVQRADYARAGVEPQASVRR